MAIVSLLFSSVVALIISVCSAFFFPIGFAAVAMIYVVVALGLPVLVLSWAAIKPVDVAPSGINAAV